MKSLRLIGYWSSDHYPDWPDVGDFIDPTWSPSSRSAVVSYLSVGHTLQQYRGLSKCRICGQLNGSKELTDETYCWPEGLAHYVAAHDVRLPDDFVRHVQAESRAAGEGSAPVFDHLGQRVRGGEYDERYDAWIDRWSKRLGSGDISAGNDPNWLNAAIDDTWWTKFVRPGP